MARKELKATEVHRCGRTARYINYETRSVELGLRRDDNLLEVHFCMDSKGGGTTEVFVRVGPKDFAAILETMVEVDRQAAMSAMSAELAKQIDEQPSHDARLATKSLDSVRRAARKKYLAAPSGSNETERFTFRMVGKLLDELKKKNEEGEKNTSSTAAAA